MNTQSAAIMSTLLEGNFITWASLTPILPELLLTLFALALVLLDLFVPRQRLLLCWLSVTALLSILAINALAPLSSGLNGMIINDAYAFFFKTLCLISVLLCALMSEYFTEHAQMPQGELYSLLLFSTVGMMIMTAANDLMTIYLGLELMALPIYALVGMHKKDTRSSEAAAKYFLMGAFASALLLFGMSLLYGLSGDTNLVRIAQYMQQINVTGQPMLLAALALILAGLCFKIAAAPFHLWTPDVYEGAPTLLSALLSVGPKAAAFAVFGRIMLTLFSQYQLNWGPVLALMAFLTMLLGNLSALTQHSLKRMLAYSAVAHAGYALMGLVPGTFEAMSATMSYLFFYLFMNTGAFCVLMLVSADDPAREALTSWKGLAAKQPLVAACMLLFMFSLTGIPPTAGFAGKFYIFKALLATGYAWLVVAALLLSVVSAYYYLRVVRLMYMEAPEDATCALPSRGMWVALGVTAFATLMFGVFPGLIFNWTRHTLFF